MPYSNNPEQERERQILEYRQRLRHEGEIRHKPKPNPQPQPSPQEIALKRTYEWMARTFPETFGAESLRRPLKLHILNDLKQFYKHAKTSQPQGLLIRSALHRYLMMDAYLETLLEGAARYDLRGAVCGTVTAEEAAKAKELLSLPFKERL